jgi:hypothetical protein
MGSRDTNCTFLDYHLTEICREQEQLRLIVMRNLANFMTNAEKCRSECKQLLVEKSTRAFLLSQQPENCENRNDPTHTIKEIMP